MNEIHLPKKDVRETGRNGIAAYLKRQVEAAGGVCKKIKFEGEKGCPDYLVLMPSKAVLLVEVKSPTGGLSPKQMETFRSFGGLGHKIAIVNSENSVDSLIRSCVKPTPRFRVKQR